MLTTAPELQNDHNVYIFGAGFSAARGLPLIADFMFALRDAHEWLLSQNRSKEAESVKKVLEFRQRSTPTAYRVQIDLENIEELFSLAAAVDESLTRDIRIAVAATLDYCAATSKVPQTRLTIERGKFALPEPLKRRLVQSDPSGKTEQLELSTYGFLVAGLLGVLDVPRHQARNAFISFNYDLLLEEALTSLEIPYSYGFAAKSVGHDASARKHYFSSTAPLQILKLHGSTNWALPGHRGGKLTIFGAYDNLRSLAYVPELVPPTWRKSLDGPLVYVWNQALKQISTATRLVVIGFSIPPTDLHFKYLVAGGLRENVSLREIVFVDPNEEGIRVRVGELFGDMTRRPRIRIVPMRAINFVGQGGIQENSLSVGRTLNGAIQHVFHGY